MECRIQSLPPVEPDKEITFIMSNEDMISIQACIWGVVKDMKNSDGKRRLMAFWRAWNKEGHFMTDNDGL